MESNGATFAVANDRCVQIALYGSLCADRFVWVAVCRISTRSLRNVRSSGTKSFRPLSQVWLSLSTTSQNSLAQQLLVRIAEFHEKPGKPFRRW